MFCICRSVDSMERRNVEMPNAGLLNVSRVKETHGRDLRFRCRRSCFRIKGTCFALILVSECCCDPNFDFSWRISRARSIPIGTSSQLRSRCSRQTIEQTIDTVLYLPVEQEPDCCGVLSQVGHFAVQVSLHPERLRFLFLCQFLCVCFLR